MYRAMLATRIVCHDRERSTYRNVESCDHKHGGLIAEAWAHRNGSGKRLRKAIVLQMLDHCVAGGCDDCQAASEAGMDLAFAFTGSRVGFDLFLQRSGCCRE
jgi:hypothetical protein